MSTRVWVEQIFALLVGLVTSAIDLSSSYDLTTDEGREDATALRRSIACAALAYLGHVSLWGVEVFNLNVGRLGCVPEGECALVSSLPRETFTRSFSTLLAALAAWLVEVERVSPTAWELLGSGQLGFWPWYARAQGQAAPSVDVALEAFGRVASIVGVPPLSVEDGEVERVRADWLEAAAVSDQEITDRNLEAAAHDPARARPAPRPRPRAPPVPAPSSSGSSAGPVVALLLGLALWGLSRRR